MKQSIRQKAICIFSVLLAVSIVFLSVISLFPYNLSAASDPSAGASGYVSGDKVNLRSGAGTSYSVITCMAKNTKFTFVDGKLYNSDWYKIRLENNTTGYIIKDYAAVSESSDSSSTSKSTGYINADDVNLRSGAGTNYSIITCMKKNTQFTFLSTQLYNSSWYNIQLTDGTIGYVIKDYVTKNPESTETTTAPSESVTDSTNPPESFEGVMIYGDVNGDGFVNINDATAIQRQIAEYPAIEEKYIPFADVNLDGTVNITDVTCITRYVAEFSEGIGAVGQPYNASVIISSTSQTLYKDNYFTLSATASGKVSWSSSDGNVATVTDGLVYAKNVGTADITAACGSASAVCKITVVSGSAVNISAKTVTTNKGRSVYLTSDTGGVTWKTSDSSIATVKNGIVDTKKSGTVVISASASGGSASCVVKVGKADNIRFTYASPNSAPLNSAVTFKAITDNEKTAVKFVVTNGSDSFTVNADKKTQDGDLYIWTGSKTLSKSGVWTVKAYSKSSGSDSFETTEDYGTGEVFVTGSADLTTTVCAERRASEDVIRLIANYEGFLPTVTADSITSDPTLGYGKVVLPGEQFYNNLTENEAYAYLCKTVNSGGYTTKTNKFLLDNNLKFNQQQFDALVCFTYNVGASVIYNDPDLQSVLLNTKSGGSSINAGDSGYVNASSVNLREGAGTNYKVLVCMAQNTKFTFVDGKLYNSDWYKIKLSDGTVGYIYKSYASANSKSGQGDLNNVNKNDFIKYFLQYHHAAGDCYKGLLYRRIDEAEVFFYGDYLRDGQNNKNGFKFTCSKNPGFTIG